VVQAVGSSNIVKTHNLLVMAEKEEGFVSLKDMQVSTSANLHGKVLHVSPMKDVKGAAFFEVHFCLSDEKVR